MRGLTSAFDTLGVYITILVTLASGVSWAHGRFARNLRRRGGLGYLRIVALHRRATVRFSSSALLSLVSNDHFLMIKTRAGSETYWAPVGGVLKFHGSSASTLRTLGALPDTTHYSDDDRDCDLRLFVPARKFRQFLDWYETSKGRETVETALLREMCEELGELGLHVDSWFRNMRLPLARAYSAPPAIFRDPYNKRLWHYRRFETVELEEPAKQGVLAAVSGLQHSSVAFINHAGIASRSHNGTRVGFHSDALLGRRIDPTKLHVEPVAAGDSESEQQPGSPVPPATAYVPEGLV